MRPPNFGRPPSIVSEYFMPPSVVTDICFCRSKKKRVTTKTGYNTNQFTSRYLIYNIEHRDRQLSYPHQKKSLNNKLEKNTKIWRQGNIKKILTSSSGLSTPNCTHFTSRSGAGEPDTKAMTSPQQNGRWGNHIYQWPFQWKTLFTRAPIARYSMFAVSIYGIWLPWIESNAISPPTTEGERPKNFLSRSSPRTALKTLSTLSSSCLYIC